MSTTDEGRQAAIDGKHYLDNPYHVKTGKHDEWSKGYWASDELKEDNSDLEASDATFSKLRKLDWEAIQQAADYLGHTGGGPLETRLRTLYNATKELLSTAN